MNKFMSMYDIYKTVIFMKYNNEIVGNNSDSENNRVTFQLYYELTYSAFDK